MARVHERDVGEELASRTTRYLDDVADCVDRLASLFDAYADGHPVDEHVAAIRELESTCDRHHREIEALIVGAEPADFGLLNARVYFTATSLATMFQRLDAVANGAERIADELEAIAPPTESACFEQLRTLAAYPAEAMVPLDAAVTTFIDVLRTPADPVSIASYVQSVREVERRCDESRNAVIEAAFADGPVERALVYREFALLIDRVVDEMEDITDRLIVISHDVPGMEADPHGVA